LSPHIQSISRLFFGKRVTPLRWLAIVPGLVAMAFLGHALEDAGLLGAAPYAAIVLTSIGYLVRPMVVLWLPLFGLFAAYSIAVAAQSEGIVPSERVIFLLLGIIPALLMLLAWPLKPKSA
jgi:hypothetical protein